MVDGYDPNYARDAARRSGLYGRSMRLFYARYSPNAEICQVLARQLEGTLALKIKCVPVSFADYLRRYAAPGEDLVYGLTSPAYDHPSAALLATIEAGCTIGDVVEALGESMDSGTIADTLSKRCALTLHRVTGNFLTRTAALQYTRLGQLAFPL